MSLYRAFTVLGLCLVSLVGMAQQAPVDAYGADTQRANALLLKAVAEYKAKGDTALAEFSRQEPMSMESCTSTLSIPPA